MRSPLYFLRGWFDGEQRQAHDRGRARAFATLNIDGAGVQFDAAFNDDKPKAGARALPDIGAAAESLEELTKILRRDADAAVAHFKNGVAPLPGHAKLHHRARF